MSGPFGSQQWMYSSGFYPHEIGNSARLDANAHYSRTPSSASNRKTWTWSAWVKRGKLGSAQTLFGAVNVGTSQTTLNFTSGDGFNVSSSGGGFASIDVTTSALFRDPSAWYHIVVAVDTTQSTSSDRVKIYVNGTQQTAFSASTYPAQDSEGTLNQALATEIGRFAQSGYHQYYSGYLAEINFIDGSALGASSFGETKADTWIPKKYTGSYGTNGYYLDFATRATDPIDASGEGNNWTDTNVVATDWMLDSPTNNFATLNPIGPRRNGANFGSGAQTQGNLTITSTSNSYFDDTEATVFNNGDTGKWYYEMRLDENHGNGGVGYEQFNIAGYYLGEFYTPSAVIVTNTGTTTLSPSSFSNGDIFMFAVDQDNGKGWFGKNGTWYTISGGGTPNPATGANPATTFGSIDRIGQVQVRSSTSSLHRTVTANFGQDSSFAGQVTAQGNTDANGIGDFYYAPPAGYLALCSANLPDPAAAFNPAVNNSPQDHFNTVLYTGNGSTNNITGVGFQPDFVWIKSRSEAYWHRAFDVLRGATKQLYTNDSAAEATESASLTAFGSDGFTLGSFQYTNNNNTTFASWNWKAGGSGVSNSDGSITSTVSANTDAGFSVFTWTGTGSSATIGHGLGQTPKVVFWKRRDSTENWSVQSTLLSAQTELELSGNSAESATDTRLGSTADWTSSVVSVISYVANNASSGTYVAYCFAEKEGFSKFGTYAGNGSADGPFINTGFRPAFVLVKNTDAAEWWTLIDNKRVGYNETNSILSPNESSAEYAAGGGGFDFTSNGFKVRGTSANFNGSGNTILYMAFAEMPFKYANAR